MLYTLKDTRENLPCWSLVQCDISVNSYLGFGGPSCSSFGALDPVAGAMRACHLSMEGAVVLCPAIHWAWEATFDRKGASGGLGVEYSVVIDVWGVVFASPSGKLGCIPPEI